MNGGRYVVPTPPRQRRGRQQTDIADPHVGQRVAIVDPSARRAGRAVALPQPPLTVLERALRSLERALLVACVGRNLLLQAEAAKHPHGKQGEHEQQQEPNDEGVASLALPWHLGKRIVVLIAGSSS